MNPVLSRVLDALLDPFWSWIAIQVGFALGLGPWVLVRRRDPPLLLLVAAALCAGGTIGSRNWIWEPWGITLARVGLWWLLLSGIWSASVLVQPAGRDELRPAADRMRLLRWFLPTLACVALAGLPSVHTACLFGLPLLVSSLLPLYDTERVRHVRRSIAWLQLGAAFAFAAGYGPRLLWLLLAESGSPDPLALPSAWGLLLPVPVAVLWALGPRVRGAGWIVGLLVAAGLLGVGRAEWLTRTERALLHLDLSDLPTRAFGNPLLPEGPRCIETPASRCPEGVEPLWVWPADAPIGDRLAGRGGAMLFSREGLLSEVPIWAVGTDVGLARLGEGAYRIAGKRVEGLQDALAVIREAREVCGDSFTFEPDPGWTAQELVTLCEYGCGYGTSRDQHGWDEVLGWVTRCGPDDLCTITNGTVGTCEQGGCRVQRSDVYSLAYNQPMRMQCDAGGCAVDGGGKAVELSCRGGGCTISGASFVTVLCDAGGCTP